VSRLGLLALAISGLLLAGCGKYGKPTRQPPRDRDAETRYTLPVIPA
jgi:hypothetical protein